MNNNEIKEEIKQKILQISANQSFCFNQIMKNYPQLSDKEIQEICYSLCHWLETQNFIQLEFSTNAFSPYDKQMSSILAQSIFLKQEKDNYVKFNKFDYDYKCTIGMGYNLQQFKIAKCKLAYLTSHNQNLFIINDEDKMVKIWNDFNNFLKKSSKQSKKNKNCATGTIEESEWFKPNIFKKIPAANEAADFFLNIFKENGFIE